MRPRRDIHVDAVYDVETEGWGKFLVGGLRRSDGKYIERKWGRENDLASEILQSGFVWAHNGGVFDHKWILSRTASKQNVQISAAGGRIVRASLARGCELFDSKALAKLALKDFSKGLGVEKEKLGLQCRTPQDCGPGCEGYCNFSRRMDGRSFSRVREYLRADCESLWQATQRLKGWGAEHDLDLCPTIGSSAWASAARLLDLPDADLSLSDHRFVRDGYYGGRVQIFRPETSSGHEYDVNALYPSTLASLDLPVGKPVRVRGTRARRMFEQGKEGIVHGVVHVPDMWVPPLPVRAKDRIAYPTGTFSGTWTCLELRYAAQFATIIDIEEGIFWPERRNVFRPWVEKLWELRRNAPGGKSSPFGIFLKFYMNSLTGKLGMRPAPKSYALNPNKITPNMARLTPTGSRLEIYEVEGCAVRKNRGGKWVAGNPCCHVEWAAYLTAEGRTRWHHQATAGGFRDLIMGDTDSVFAVSKRTENIGDDLGQWQDKGEFRDFKAEAPKFYSYRPVGNPEMVYRSKGIRCNRREEFERLFSEGSHEFHWKSSRGFRDALRLVARTGEWENLFSEKQFDRKIKRGYGDRVFVPEEGITRPPRIEELNAAGAFAGRIRDAA